MKVSGEGYRSGLTFKTESLLEKKVDRFINISASRHITVHSIGER